MERKALTTGDFIKFHPATLDGRTQLRKKRVIIFLNRLQQLSGTAKSARNLFPEIMAGQVVKNGQPFKILP